MIGMSVIWRYETKRSPFVSKFYLRSSSNRSNDGIRVLHLKSSPYLAFILQPIPLIQDFSTTINRILLHRIYASPPSTRHIPSPSISATQRSVISATAIGAKQKERSEHAATQRWKRKRDSHLLAFEFVGDAGGKQNVRNSRFSMVYHTLMRKQRNSCP